jgi:protein-L-isoaspartate(D-aspartate) O-methyltransferase
MEELIQELLEEQILKSKAIVSALCAVDRADFVPEKILSRAYENTALPIGFGQTISQPYTVVFMLELLEVKKGQRIMDVGFGSGWQSALISHLLGEEGKIYAFEIRPELCKFGKQNLQKYPALISKISFFCQNAREGVAELGPNSLDRIIVAADTDEIPKIWREQLIPGGIMVYAGGHSIFKEVKKQDGSFEKREFPGFIFVPLK